MRFVDVLVPEETRASLSKLIQRLYIPKGGKIAIDGIEISLVSPAQLRTQIGVVLQENFMFSGTVAENISIHCPAIGIERLSRSRKLRGLMILYLSCPMATTL